MSRRRRGRGREDGEKSRVKKALEDRNKSEIEKVVSEKGIKVLNENFSESEYHDHRNTPFLFYLPPDVEFLKWLVGKYGDDLEWDCYFTHRHEGGSERTPLVYHYVETMDAKKENVLEFLKYLMKVDGVKVEKYGRFRADWMRYAGANEKRHIMEVVIKKNYLKLAKFMIEDLEINYFNFNDFNLADSWIRRKQPELYQKVLNNFNETRKYVHSKRNLWNPSHFKYFSKEYQKNVMCFLWVMKQLGTPIPKDMFFTIYQFIDFCDFEYIYGNLKTNEKGEEVYVWEECPDFLSNEKLYLFQLKNIKNRCSEIFGEEKYDVEFKCIIDKLVYDKLDASFKKYCMVNHWPLVTLVFDLKNKIYETDSKEVVKLLMDSVNELYGEKYVRKSEIGYRYDNPQQFNWLGNGVNDTGYGLKVYSLKKREQNFEEEFGKVLNEFVKFVMNLR